MGLRGVYCRWGTSWRLSFFLNACLWTAGSRTPPTVWLGCSRSLFLGLNQSWQRREQIVFSYHNAHKKQWAVSVPNYPISLPQLALLAYFLFGSKQRRHCFLWLVLPFLEAPLLPACVLKMQSKQRSGVAVHLSPRRILKSISHCLKCHSHRCFNS